MPEKNGNAAGGLAVALDAAFETENVLWFGTSDRISDDAQTYTCLQQRSTITYATIDLSPAEYHGYYENFSNRTLWPLMHGRVDIAELGCAALETYRSVNARFSRQLGPLLASDDVIWVHDYHLCLLGMKLRAAGLTNPLGFFLHIPFPPPDVFAVLPCAKELAAGLAAYDLIGFQTANDAENFRQFLVHHLGARPVGGGHVRVLGRQIRIGVFPVGIDTQRFAALGASPEVARLRQHAVDSWRTHIVGVDRLDYTKGIANKLRAVHRLFETEPGQIGRTTLVQVTPPSREAIPEYAILKDELEILTAAVNFGHGKPGWTPVHLIAKTLDQMHLAGLYRAAKVALVTPLRDGMNLVAKEYVASQDPDDPGVLVLSRNAGAAERWSGPLIVDPNNVDDISRNLQIALAMPLDERQHRWCQAMAELRRHDIYAWRDNFLTALTNSREQIAGSGDVMAEAGDPWAAASARARLVRNNIGQAKHLEAARPS